MVHTFQVFLRAQSQEAPGPLREAVSNDYTDLVQLFARGAFDAADGKLVLRVYYHVFFDKSLITQEKISIAISAMMAMFKQWFYLESRLKDIESLGYLNKKKNYTILMSRMGANSEAEVNMILIQQEILRSIQYLSHVSQEVSEACWKEIDTVFTADYSAEINQTKLYLYLKLAISIMRNDELENKTFYGILISEDYSLAYQSWTLVRSCSEDKFNQQFWEAIAKKVRLYLQYQVDKRKQQHQQQEANTATNARQGQISQLRDELNNLIQRNMSEINHDNTMAFSQDVISDATYQIYKRFLLYGLQNTQIANKLFRSMLSILSEAYVKEVDVNIFEIKLMIYKHLIIAKDKSADQDELLKEYQKIVKNLLIFVNSSNVKLNSATQAGSASRRAMQEDSQNFSLREAERNRYAAQIRNLISIVVSSISGYLDYKDSLQIENKVLDMMHLDSFYPAMETLRKLVLSSQTVAKEFMRHVLRAYLYQETEGSVLKGEAKGRSFSSRALEYMFNLASDIIEYMTESASQLPIITEMIDTLYMNLVGESFLQLVRFSKNVSVSIIKNIKKLMIYLREKDISDESVKQMKLILQKVFSITPNPAILKEYLSFFREIFYYDQDMDNVDSNLALDTLQVLNNLLKNDPIRDHCHLSLNNIGKTNHEDIYVQDYFYFSDATPGLVITEQFMYSHDKFSLNMLFQIDQCQLERHYKQNSTDKACLTFFSLKSTTDPTKESQPITINTYQQYIIIQDQQKPIDDKWHFLSVRFKKRKITLSTNNFEMFVYIDDMAKPINQQGIQLQLQKKQPYIFAYGCQLKEYREKGAKMRTENRFQGKLSLIMGVEKFKIAKYCSEQKHYDAFRDFISNSIQKNHVLSLKAKDIGQFMTSRNLKLRHDLKDLEMMDNINENCIIMHKKACDQGHLSAIHSIKPNQTFVGLGGFKLMYPLFEKSLASNLNIIQKSDIWKFLFKILRTLMNIEPAHIHRLYKNKNLIEILKYCLIRSGLDQQNLLTKDLLTEVIKIVRDIRVNASIYDLEGFYRRFLHDIILSESFCALRFSDQSRQYRNYLVFTEIADNLDSLLQKHHVAQISQKDSKQRQDIGEFIERVVTNEDCFRILMGLIRKFSQKENSRQLNKISSVIIKIIIRMQSKELFFDLMAEVIELTQQYNQPQLYNRTKLKALLKIWVGVLQDKEFSKSPILVSSFRTCRGIDKLQRNYIISASYGNDEYKLCDSIAALTFRISYKHLGMFQDKVITTRLPERHIPTTEKSRTNLVDERHSFYEKTFEILRKNSKNLKLPKTLCTFFFLIFDVSQKEKKFTPRCLTEFVKSNSVNCLKVMNDKEKFDKDLFDQALRFVTYYDLDTKLVFIDFFRNLMEKKEARPSQATRQLHFQHMLGISKQENRIIEILQIILSTNEQGIIEGSLGNIITTVIKAYIDTTQDPYPRSFIEDKDNLFSTRLGEEKNFLNFIKKLIVSIDKYPQGQINIFNDIAIYLQQKSIELESSNYEDCNRGMLNISILYLMHLIEETLIRKHKAGSFLTDETFFQVIGRLMLVCDHRNILDFDLPNPSIIDTDDEERPIERRFQQSFDITGTKINHFLAGGNLRIFLSILLQMVRKNRYHQSKFQKCVQLLDFFLFSHESEFLCYLGLDMSRRNNNNETLLKKVYSVINVPLKKEVKLNYALDFTIEYMIKLEKKQTIQKFMPKNETLLMTAAFLPLIVLNELYEIARLLITKKSNTHQNEDNYYEEDKSNDESKYQCSEILKMIQRCLLHAFTTEECGDDVGTIFLTIAEPRIKSALFTCMLNLQNYEPEQHNTLFFLSNNYIPNYDKETMAFRNSSSQEYDPSASPTPINMKNSYFRPQSAVKEHEEDKKSADDSNVEDNNSSKVDQESEEGLDLNDSSQQFAGLEKSVVEQSIITKNEKFGFRDDSEYIKYVVKFLNAFYAQLSDFIKQPTPSAFTAIQQEYFTKKEPQLFFQAVRIVSSDRLKEQTKQLYENTFIDEKILRVQEESPDKLMVSQHLSNMRLNQERSLGNQEGMMNVGQSQFKIGVQGTNQTQEGSPGNMYNNSNKMLQSTESLPPFEVYSEDPPIVSQSHGEHRTMQYFYTKYQYKKIVRRLNDDQSSLWYDQLEQMRKDYTDLKDIYDLICVSNPLSRNNADIYQEEETKSRGNQSNRKPINPVEPEIKRRQYNHFVRQRRNYDTWGRMMLLKPDRKYKDTKFWMTHIYYVHDFLRSFFAVSFLNDEDFPDYTELLQNLENQQQSQNSFTDQQLQFESNAQDANQSDIMTESMNNQPNLLAKSEQFKKLRDILMQKIEQNAFLYSLMSDPEKMSSEKQTIEFEYHAPVYEQNRLEFDVQYVTVEGQYNGVLYLSDKYIMFKSYPPRKNEDYLRDYRFALQIDRQHLKKEKVWLLNEIDQVFKRRFMLIQQGCEIFTKEKKSYFFAILSKEPNIEENCQKFFTQLKLINKKIPKTSRLDIVTSPATEFKKRKFYEDWLKGQISNQQLLLLINKFSGRTFNDLSQYPMFPWVIHDHCCTQKDLMERIQKGGQDTPLRDLFRHSGILTDQKLKSSIELYEKDEDAKFMYGTEPFNLKFGFSNKMFSLAYLIRMEPFTDSFHKVNTNMENPDRVMYSIGDQYHSILYDPQNNSELIPEFFYFPEVLRNHNLCNFGKNNDGMSVNEVILPPYSTNEHDFIRVNREVLDSKQVAQKLPFWIDLNFGQKQRQAEYCNIFFNFAYEKTLKDPSIRREINDSNLLTISDFMQVPQQLFNEHLFQEKKGAKTGVVYASNAANPYQMSPMDQQQLESENAESMSTPIINQGKQNKGSGGTQKSFFGRKPKVEKKAAPKENSTQLIETSLIRRLMDNHFKKEQELSNICEIHRIAESDRHIFHMILPLSKCVVFYTEAKNTETEGAIKVSGCSENLNHEDFRVQCLTGLKLENLKGDLSSIFQVQFSEKSPQKYPLLFTCQNLDNTIKIFDLNLKKGSMLVHQETYHNNTVMVIKFSSDEKYFISGDADGVLLHYAKASDEHFEMQSSALATSAPILLSSSKTNPVFPYYLKYKIQDHMGAVLALDINQTLDMYVTASADGTIALRCLRTSMLWKVIQNEKLVSNREVVSLKLSLHGYIFIVIKTPDAYLNYVYSLNGDELTSTSRGSKDFTLKCVHLNQKEDMMIQAFNHRKNGADWTGSIRIVKLYDLSKVRENLEYTFYGIVTLGNTQQNRSRQEAGLSAKLQTKMPKIKAAALNLDESKMNLVLSTREAICFDESKEQIIAQLDDFGLT